MPRRFTLAELLLWVTLAALLLAFIVPIWRDVMQTANLGNRVVSVAASADGSTFGGLLGDGKLLVWDSEGTLKTTLQTRGGFEGQVALSADGRLAAVSTGWQPVGVQPPRQTVEFWDIDSRKLLKATPASLRAHVALSPDGETFALIDEHSLTLDSPTNATHLGTIGASGVAVAFSPDGRTIAVATDTKGVETYRTVTQQCVQRLGPSEDRWPWSWVDLCWSPDGQTLAALCTFPEDGQETIQLWRDEDEDARSLALPAGDDFFSLAFLPGGRSLALVGVSGMTQNSIGSSIVMLLDATTLNLSTAKRIDDVSMVAAGAKGDTFLTAGFFNVDLRDAATLEPRRTLFGESPSFRIWPTTIGLVAWLLWYGAHRARKLRRPCQTCGRPFQPAGRKDTNVECLTCRQKADTKRLTTAQAARRQSRMQRQGWLVLLLADGCLAALIALVAGEGLGFVWPFVTAAVVLPVLLIGSLLARGKWKLLRAANPARDFAQADGAAGASGSTRQIGEMLVWTTQTSSLAELLENQAEVARQRLVSVLGRNVPAPTARAMFFEDADATARYMRALGMQVAAPPRQRGFYWGARPPRIVVVERSVREQGCSPQITLRSLLVYHLLEAIDGRRRVAWIDQGLAAALSHDDEYQELARLNRRVMAGLAAGRTIGAVEFFTATTNRVWWKHMRHAELNHFAWGNQFAAQAWSVMEFVCGRGATPDRRQAFRACLTDAGRRRRPAEAIERHFCCSCDELLAKWRNWVESQGVGEHLLPPKHIADHLLAEPIARLDSPDALPGERVSAIRELGEGGYLLGADRLIAALHGDNPEIAAEAVWALESISGQVLGSSSGVWEEWWAGVEDGLPSSCRETVTA